MCQLDPLEALRLELHATLAERIAKLDNPTESDVQRILQSLRTENLEFDREMSELADTLLLLALNKPFFLKALSDPDFPDDFHPDFGPINLN